MSFSSSVKKELLSMEMNFEQASAFVQGVIDVSSDVDKVSIKDEELFNLFIDLIRQMKLNFKVVNKSMRLIEIIDFKRIEKIRMPSFYFAGIFYGGGSISNPRKTSYHLEVRSKSEDRILFIQEYLNKYTFKFKKIFHKNKYVLYIKKADQIADFLKAIRAVNALFEFEEVRISRDHRNQLNRYSNLDFYNQQKLVDSSIIFKRQIRIIKSNNLEDQFRKEEWDFFKLKINNNYMSLSDLTNEYNQKFGQNKTRAGLNHYILKLRKVLNDNQLI